MVSPLNSSEYEVNIKLQHPPVWGEGEAGLLQHWRNVDSEDDPISLLHSCAFYLKETGMLHLFQDREKLNDTTKKIKFN